MKSKYLNLRIPLSKYLSFIWMLFWATILRKPLEIDKYYFDKPYTKQ